MPRRKRIALTESELESDTGEQAGRADVAPSLPADLSTIGTGRAPRKAKEGASKKWESLKPGQSRKKKRTEDVSRPTSAPGEHNSLSDAAGEGPASDDSNQGKASSQGRSKPQPRPRRVRRIDPNLSSNDEQDYTLNDTHVVGGDTAEARPAPVAQQRSAPGTDHERSGVEDELSDSSSVSSSEAERTDNEDEALTAMESNAEALEKLFASERVHWANESNDNVQPQEITSAGQAKSTRTSSLVRAKALPHHGTSRANPLSRTSASPLHSGNELSVSHSSSGRRSPLHRKIKKKHHMIIDECTEIDTETPPTKKPAVIMPQSMHDKSSKMTMKATDKANLRKQGRVISREDETPKFVHHSSSRDPRAIRSRRKSHGWSISSEPSDSDDSEEQSDDSVESSDSDSHSEDSGIEIVPPRRGKLKLRDQHRRVRRVLSRGILNVQVELAMKNAFPDGAQTHGKMVYRALIKAAADLGYEDIIKRLRKKDAYTDELAKVPSQRIPTYRGNVRKLVEGQAGSVFELKFGNREKGDWLHSKFRYIYPFDYEKKTYQASKPYSPPIYVETLRAAFFKHAKSLGFKIAHLVESSLPDKPNEKELPAPLLALVATAIHAVIEDCKMGHRRPRDFSTNEYWGVYKDHMLILSNIRTKGPVQYHVLMHGLWRELYGTTDNIGSPGNVGDAMPDIEGMARE
ncbi:hypothetical protein C8Q77DRAFT_1072902 [Trametes polyzona]|nr:hypothetical protein C8Q77DRAFT_1072902 [Trametes polyzona]